MTVPSCRRPPDEPPIVTAVDPMDLLGSLAGDPETHAVAVEAGTKLGRVIESIGT